MGGRCGVARSRAKRAEPTSRAPSQPLGPASERLGARVNGSETASRAAAPRPTFGRVTLRRFFLLCLALAAAAAAGSAAEGGGGRENGGRYEYFSRTNQPAPPPGRVPDIRFRRGDDARWAAPDFDDSAWARIDGREMPSRDGIYWVRWRVPARWPQHPAAPLRDGLLLKVVASYELYWDGRFIGRNGRPSADRDDEAPGVVDALFQIPPELLGPGEHLLALRMSSWHTGFPAPTYGLNFTAGNFRTMLVQRSRTALFSVMAVGASLVAATVFGLMWLLAGRRRALLLLAVLFFCVAIMQALQAWRWLYDYPYSWHYPRLVAITALTTALAVLLPVFLLEHFGLRRRWSVYGPLAVFLTHAWFSSPIYNWISLYVCAVGFSVAFGVAAAAVWKRRRGAPVVAFGLAASLAALMAAPRDFLDHAFFLSAGPALLGLLVAVVLRLRDERREAQQAVLTAARLEIELLKKNIQPHFLINTLATVQETVEQDPRTAATLIEALAAEFRILSRVSGEKLIPLAQELELCRAHLGVMSLRKGARCTLAAHGTDGDAPVPPALFHTLIENGLTHLLPRDGRLDFELRAEPVPGGTRYTFLARGVRQSAEPAPAAVKDGTGLRYIKARLEESFTGRWSLAGAQVPEGWLTTIELRHGGARSAVAPAPHAAPAGTPAGKPA